MRHDRQIGRARRVPGVSLSTNKLAGGIINCPHFSSLSVLCTAKLALSRYMDKYNISDHS